MYSGASGQYSRAIPDTLNYTDTYNIKCSTVTARNMAMVQTIMSRLPLDLSTQQVSYWFTD